MISPSGPRVLIACGEERVDFGVGEVSEDLVAGAFGWDREDPLDRSCVLGVIQREVGKQGMDRCEALVAGCWLVVAVMFEMFEECGDQHTVEVADIETARRFAGPVGGEAEQQAERELVCGDRVRAGSTLGDQALREVGLQGRCEHRHGRVPYRVSSRSAADAINSGAADRYQYVSAGATWPR